MAYALAVNDPAAVQQATVSDAQALADKLRRFVPGFARHAIAGQLASAPMQMHTGTGAVLVADIAGFSALTERKAREGPAGIEGLQNLLNACFGLIVTTIEAGGGEVYKFAGDATIAWWPARDGNLHAATTAAAATALRLQALASELAGQPQNPLSLRVGIGAGNAFTAIVGGDQGRWEALLGGDALEQVSAARAVTSGQVLLSQPAWRVLQHDCSGESLAEGGFALHAVTPASLAGPAPQEPPADTAALAALVPRHLVQRLSAGHHNQLAELRAATVLFANLAVPQDLATLQSVTLALQHGVHASGGSVVQFLVDDKADLVLVAAWGIPGSSYPDDAERAVRSAHALVNTMADTPTPLAAGVASGRVFAGLRGNLSRAEFALIGAVVNRAARLAQTAQPNQVLCDAATGGAVAAIGFAPRPAIRLKGLSGTAVYESLGQRRVDATVDTGAMIGRQPELDRMLATLQRLLDDPGRSAVVLIEGTAGIGKSHLCAAFARAVRGRGLRLATGASDPLDNSAAYRPLRGIFDSLLGLAGDAPAATRRERVLALLDQDDRTREHASLLSEVLDLALPASTTEQQMRGRGRIEATTDLLVSLLRATGDGSLRVVMMEDLHWLDSASQAVFEQALRRCPGLLLVLSTRPSENGAGPALPFDDADCTHLTLTPLDENAVRDIIANELGAGEVPEPVLRAVADRTQGMPLFVRQVVASLVDGLIVHCSQGVISYDAQGLAAYEIPDTIQGVVISRIDRLTTRQQTTLKTASVAGHEFSFDALNNANADSAGAEALWQDLHALVADGLIETGADSSQFRFSHALVRDAVYSLLPFGVRRGFHAAMAAWYGRHAGDDPLMLARIATHWDKAHDPAHAVAALEQAGDHALRTGAYREAQTLFARLVAITQHGFGEGATEPVPARDDQRARWQLNLGQAGYDLGELEQARVALETAARLLGDAVPSARGVGLRVAWEAAQTLLPARLRKRGSSETAASRARQRAAVLSTLGRIYHLTQRPRHTVYSILRRINLLQAHPPSPEQMSACGGMMYICTLMGRHRQADAYATRVTELHRRLQHPLAYADANLTMALAYMGEARWAPCERAAADAQQNFERLGERQSRMVILAIMANSAELQGAFDRSADLWQLLERLSREVGDEVGQCWAAGGMAMLAIRRGNFDEGAIHARRAVTLARRTGEAISYLADTGLLALCLFETGAIDACRPLVREGIHLLAALPRIATAHHLLNGLDTFTELALRLWEHDAPARGSDAWRQWAHDSAMATRRTSGYARRFAIGRPMAARHTALMHWQQGRHAKALVGWEQAIAEGRQTAIPYETGKGHLELARHLAPGDPRRAEHARQATEIFERIGAAHALARARALDAG